MQATTADEFGIFNAGGDQVDIITNPTHEEGYFVDFEIEEYFAIKENNYDYGR